MVPRIAVVALAALVFAPAVARAQDARSADLAKQFALLLDQKKIDSFAAPEAPDSDTYIAALYFPGTQLLIVSAKYAAPALLTELIARKDYRAVYAELTSASVAGSKTIISDVYANGLAIKPSGGNPPDSFERGSTTTVFDGAWKKAKITEADYQKTFSDADAAYVRALQSLIGHLKNSGT